MTVPVIEPSSAGGISSTTGPTSFVLMKGVRYIASGFGVRVWIFQSGRRDQ